MQLTKIEDPRDTLAKTRWKDLRKYLEQNPMEGLDPYMPADVIKRKLRERGIHRIPATITRLGAPESPNAGQPEVPQEGESREMDATALLEAQYTQSQSLKSYSDMSMGELRAACKARGLKISRTDKKPELVEKLNGDTSPSGQ